MKNVGLFGGTFDPVHNGHIELARFAMTCCQLSELIFIPSASPPHKDRAGIASFQHRVEMLKLMVAAEKKFSISTIEEKLNPPSFTIDTLNLFLKYKKEPENFYFIIGVDAFVEIHTWKNYKEVLKSVNFIVSARQGYSRLSFEKYMNTLRYFLKGSVWHSYQSKKKIYYLREDVSDISSSDIREGIKGNNLRQGMISPAVLQYISTNGLYSWSNKYAGH